MLNQLKLAGNVDGSTNRKQRYKKYSSKRGQKMIPSFAMWEMLLRIRTNEVKGQTSSKARKSTFVNVGQSGITSANDSLRIRIGLPSCS